MIFNEINWNAQIFFLCEKASNTDVFSFLTLSGNIIVKYLRLRGIFKNGKEKPERGFAQYLLFRNMYHRFKIGKSKNKESINKFIVEDAFLRKNISMEKADVKVAAADNTDINTDTDTPDSADSVAANEDEIEYEFYCFVNFCLYWNWVFNYIKMEHMSAMVTLKKFWRQILIPSFKFGIPSSISRTLTYYRQKGRLTI